MNAFIRPSRGRRLAACAAIASLVASSTVSAEDACTAIATVAMKGVSILSAKPVPAGASSNAPAFCEVRATIAPVEGSHIGAVYRLPASWNGKVLGIGGGGFAGNLRVEAAADGLARGYAVIENDLGHASANALDPSFAIGADGKPNVDGIIDFGHRATHLATTTGKEIVTQRGELPASGCLVIGEKGKLFAGDDYGSSFVVMLNDEKEYTDARKHPAAMNIPQSIPRNSDTVGRKVDTDLGMKLEWFKAMKGKPEDAYSRFDVAAFLTETILLGCIALKSGVGHKLDWDGPNMKATNDPEAARFVKRQNRKGWELDLA